MGFRPLRLRPLGLPEWALVALLRGTIVPRKRPRGRPRKDEAELAKGLLDSAGIESFLFDDNMVRMDWFNANALGGVKLRVDAHNVEAANQVLQEVSAEVEPEEPESLA